MNLQTITDLLHEEYFDKGHALTWQRIVIFQAGQFGNTWKYRISANQDGYEAQSWVKIEQWSLDGGWTHIYTFHGTINGVTKVKDRAHNQPLLDAAADALLAIATAVNS